MIRCGWCESNEKMIAYHDEEWGVPLYDDQKQFEFLMLEVMQCGLNWNMMIAKREIFRACFDGFDYTKVAAYGEDDILRIFAYPGMIRSRRKIEAVIHNARCFQAVREAFGTFSAYLWGFSGGKTLVYPQHQTAPVARNALSDEVSRDLKKRGVSTAQRQGTATPGRVPSAVLYRRRCLSRSRKSAPDTRSSIDTPEEVC